MRIGTFQTPKGRTGELPNWTKNKSSIFSSGDGTGITLPWKILLDPSSHNEANEESKCVNHLTFKIVHSH